MSHFQRKRVIVLTMLAANSFILAIIFFMNSNQLLQADESGGCSTFPMMASNESELNHAIACFNQETNAGVYTVTLSADIDLITSTTPISNSTTGAAFYLDGDGFTVDGQDIADLRPFHIEVSTTVQMQALTVQGGFVDSGGGGIRNEGSLWLMDVTLAENNADSYGAGLYNLGSATAVIADSTIFANRSGSYGAGIYNRGVMTVTNSHVVSNTAGSYGAGFYNCCVAGASLTIIDSEVVSNTSGSYGAGIYNCCSTVTVTLESSQVHHNHATTYGGGIYNCCSTGTYMTLSESQVYSNTSGSYGAGIYNCCSSSMVLNSSQVHGNVSGSYGAGIYNCCGSSITINQSQISSNVANSYGGGFYNCCGGDATVINSTISDNEAATEGGGVRNSSTGVMTMTNSTVSGNRAGYGAGIFVGNESVLTLDFVTVSDNTAVTATGGISITDISTVTMSSSIVANSVGGDCASSATFNDGGYNLVEDGGCITEMTSLTGDPDLGPLADNGGAAQTQAPLPGSSVIDAIPEGTNGCGTTYLTDQRNRPRPFDGDLNGITGCDMGAVEVGEQLYLPSIQK